MWHTPQIPRASANGNNNAGLVVGDTYIGDGSGLRNADAVEQSNSLTKIFLNNNPQISDSSLAKLDLASVTVLNIANTRATDGLQRHWHEASRMKVLDISGTSVGNKTIIAMMPLSDLEYLNASDSGFTGKNVPTSSLQKLNEIYLAGLVIDDQFLVEVVKNLHLKRLSLRRAKFSGSVLDSLQSTSIVFVDISETNASDLEVASIAKWPLVTKLYIQYSKTEMLRPSNWDIDDRHIEINVQGSSIDLNDLAECRKKWTKVVVIGESLK